MLYRSLLIPILSHGSVLWKPWNSDLWTIETVQEKTIIWTFGTMSIEYKSEIGWLGRLSLPFYCALHVLLVLFEVVNGIYSIDWSMFNGSLDKTNQCKDRPA